MPSEFQPDNQGPPPTEAPQAPATDAAAFQQAFQQTTGASPEQFAQQPGPPPSQPGQQPGQQFQPQAAPAPSTTLRDAFVQQNPEAAQYFQSDDDLLDGLNAMYQQAQSAPDPQTLQQFAQYQPLLAEFAQHRPHYAAWLQQQQAQQSQAGPQQQPTSAWQAPELSSKASEILATPNLVGRTGDGGLGLWDAISQEYVQHPLYIGELREIEGFMRHQQEVQRKLATDPVGTIWEAGLQDRIQGMLPDWQQFANYIAQMTLAQVNQLANQGQIAATIDSQADLFFEKDPKSGELKTQLNPQTRQLEYVKTPLGQLYQQASQLGVDRFGIDPSDTQRLHEFALYSIQPYMAQLGGQQSDQQQQAQPGQQQQAPPNTVAGQRAQNQDAFLARANGNQANSRFDQPITVSQQASQQQFQCDTDEDAWRAAVDETIAQGA